MSHAVRDLEQALGAALFLREGRSIRLTPDGETLVQHVDRAFDELRFGIGAVSARGPKLLRLHSAPTFAANWLAPRLRRMLGECDGLEVRISARVDYTRFLADEFDADVVYGLPQPDAQGGGSAAQRGIVVLPLGTETVTPLCAPALAAEIRAPRDLLRHSLIESDNKRVRWPAWFAANGLPAPEARGPRFDRSFLSLSAAADGLGVALESLLLAERDLASRRLVRPLEGGCEDITYTGHWLVFPRAKQHFRPLVAFRQWLAAELGLAAEPAPSGAAVQAPGGRDRARRAHADR